MTQERADEIVRKVIYARLNVMPKMKDSEDAFHIGRMIGQMQRQLEIELSLEVDRAESDERWIPVSERFPDIDEQVLVDDGVGRFVAWKTIDGWDSNDRSYIPTISIKAWMPLPQPYKAESEE